MNVTRSRRARRTTLLLLGLLLLAVPAQAAPQPGSPVTAGKKAYQTSLIRWRASKGDFAPWSRAGTVLGAGGELRLDPAGATAGTDPYGPGGYRGGTFYNGGTFLVGQATSPLIATPQGFSEAIASWNASTPPGTWMETLIRARVNGRFTKSYNLGVWASDSSTVARHSVRAQGDADGFVAVDTLILDDKLRADGFELTFRLFSDTPGAVPSLRSVSLALSSDYNKIGEFAPGNPALWDRVLAVPECSQMVYPDGGAVWCSPTSTSMVLAYWANDNGPCEPRVRAAVAGVYDWVYDGDGNWPFNTAYAGRDAGLEAEVVRFESMADAEPWVAAGVPVVISYYWHVGDLTGAPIPSSDGHLAVLVGFDAAGNPIVNDPAAATDDQVQRTYPRSELEHLWVKKSGGTAYLVYPTGHPVPPVPGA